MKPLRSTPIDIPVRMDIEFDFSDVPAVHTAGNPLVSHLWNALSLLAPTFETAAIRVLRHALKDLAEPALRKDVDAFIKQEALHSRHHAAFNQRLGEFGADVAAFTALGRTAWQEAMAGRDTRQQLAMIVAAEHLIHDLSIVGLSTPQVLADTHPEVRRLLTWHMVEEVEHQSVSLDVYRHLYGDGPSDWATHTASLWAASGVFLRYSARIQRVLLGLGESPTRSQRIQYQRFLWSDPGILRRVLLRTARHALPWSRTWSDPREVELIRTPVERPA